MKKDGKKNYSKVDYCYYCEKPVKYKMSRHLKKVHREENAVIEALRLPSQTARKMVLLQNMGNFKHNTQVDISTFFLQQSEFLIDP
jgi:hypothetical protein